jgi:tetratricopeptide (TPR) repeat protein
VASARSIWIGALLLSLTALLCAIPYSAEAAPESASAGPVSVEANPQLFATMCALVAAGFGADSPLGNPDFMQLRTQLRALHGPATEALREFFRQHAVADRGATLSRFVTFALTAGPAPKFEPVLKRANLPPDVLALDGFSQVLASFYEEAQVEQLWRQFQPAYERDALSLRGPLGQIVLSCTGYLREIIRPGSRRFAVYVEPMVGNATNVRNVGDSYVVVVNPGSPPFDLIRHAFLHFLLDPLAIRYRDKLIAEQPLQRIAVRAPRLPNEYRTDLTSFFTESLIQAVELRLRKLPQAQLDNEVNTAEADGYVLIRPLVKALAKFEISEPAISFYFPDLLQSIDVISEQQRLQRAKFAAASDSVPAREPVEIHEAKSQSAVNSAPDLDAELNAAERLIAGRDAVSAASAFGRILEKTPGQPRALYGLAVASVLQGDADHARTLFQQVVTAGHSESPGMRPEPDALAWSHVYLGRMHDLEGDREQAVDEYRSALAVTNAPEAAQAAAQRGVEEGYRPAVRNPSPE